jgi:transposase
MFIGIDVGRKYLDLAARPAATAVPQRVPNTATGIATVVETVRALAPRLVVCEATGNYHRPLLAAMLAAAVPVAVLNPVQIAAFRQSQLGRHKTDRADAQLLARFAELHHEEVRQATADEPHRARLRALVGYRDDLVARRTRLRNQQHAAEWAGEASVVAWLQADLDEVAQRLQEVERAIKALVVTLPETAALLPQTGVHLLTAAAVLAYLPTGVLGNPKAAAAYAGLHPRQDQSGQRRHSHLSKQGCPPLRRYLFMAALAAIRWDPAMAAWHQQLLARGKADKSAICAVAHKVLRQLMGKIREARRHQELTSPVAA